jgi:hypothetical protein
MRSKLSGLLICIALYFPANVREHGHWGQSRHRDSLILDHRLESVMARLVRVKLTGGPEGTPPTWEVGSLEDEGKIRILFGNRYEHFEYAHCSVQIDGRMMPVYQWSYRTYIAE